MTKPRCIPGSTWQLRLLLLSLILVFVYDSAAAQRTAQPRGGGSAGSSSVNRGSSGSPGRSASHRPSGGGDRSPSRAHRPTGNVRPRDGYRPGYGLYPGYGFGYWGPRYRGVRLGVGAYWGYPWPYGYWGWNGYYGYPYYGPYAPPYVVADRGVGDVRPSYETGAVQLKVKPKKAQVFVDGRFIGEVRNFDGTPRYLWLERGAYELAFYMPGYETMVRDVEVIPGAVVELSLRMVEGDAVLPERANEAEAPWREDRGAVDRRLDGSLPDAAPADDSSDFRQEPARLRLDVYPAEASVYLDGRFLGSGREVVGLRSPLLIDAGDHVLQVVHPDFSTRRREFTVESGQIFDLQVDLRPRSGA